MSSSIVYDNDFFAESSDEQLRAYARLLAADTHQVMGVGVANAFWSYVFSTSRNIAVPVELFLPALAPRMQHYFSKNSDVEAPVFVVNFTWNEVKSVLPVESAAWFAPLFKESFADVSEWIVSERLNSNFYSSQFVGFPDWFTSQLVDLLWTNGFFVKGINPSWLRTSKDLLKWIIDDVDHGESFKDYTIREISSHFDKFTYADVTELLVPALCRWRKSVVSDRDIVSKVACEVLVAYDCDSNITLMLQEVIDSKFFDSVYAEDKLLFAQLTDVSATSVSRAKARLNYFAGEEYHVFSVFNLNESVLLPMLNMVDKVDVAVKKFIPLVLMVSSAVVAKDDDLLRNMVVKSIDVYGKKAVLDVLLDARMGGRWLLVLDLFADIMGLDEWKKVSRGCGDVEKFWFLIPLEYARKIVPYDFEKIFASVLWKFRVNAACVLPESMDMLLVNVEKDFPGSLNDALTAFQTVSFL